MTTPAAPSGIDPRGPRFGALVTAAVLAATVLTGSVWLLAVQTAVFAVGAFAGIGASPYGRLFRAFVRPRLAPPAEFEDLCARAARRILDRYEPPRGGDHPS